MNTLAKIMPASALPDGSPSQPPGMQFINDIVGWGAWIVLALCVLGVIVSAGTLVWASQTGRELQNGKGIVIGLIGAVIVGAASGLVAAAS